MNIKREKLLNSLIMTSPGLSPREYIEQSSCFVFRGGAVHTFNDEVACKIKTDLGIEGAIQSTALLDILRKLDDDTLLVRENENGEIEFKGKRKTFAVRKDAEIFLPIEKVEQPKNWRELSPEFTEAIGMVGMCICRDDSKFVLTCIHLHPEFIEACDMFQIIRCKVDIGLKESVLVRGSSVKEIPSLAMDEVALTKSWIHFRNAEGLQYSVRRYADEFPDLDSHYKIKGHPIVLPKGVAKATECAAVFATDGAVASQVQVRLADGKMRIKGEGNLGWYREVKKVAYDGPPMTFFIQPLLLQRISDKYKEAVLTENKLAVKGGSWRYVTVLSAENTPEGGDEEKEEKPRKKRKQEDNEE